MGTYYHVLSDWMSGQRTLKIHTSGRFLQHGEVHLCRQFAIRKVCSIILSVGV